jgi:predicted ATPase
MSYPGATLLTFDGGSIREIAYTATDHYQITRNFLQDPERHLQELFSDSDEHAGDDDINDG